MLPAAFSSPAPSSPYKRLCESWVFEPTSVLDIQSPSPTSTSLFGSGSSAAPHHVFLANDGLAVEKEDGIMDEDGSSSTITDMMMPVVYPQLQTCPPREQWADDLQPLSGNDFPVGIADKGIDDLDSMFLSSSLPHPPDQSLMKLLFGEAEDPFLLLPPHQQLQKPALGILPHKELAEAANLDPNEQHERHLNLQVAMEAQIPKPFSESCFHIPTIPNLTAPNPAFSPPFTFRAVNPPAILNFCDQSPQLMITDACLLPLCYQPNFFNNFQAGCSPLERMASVPHNLPPGSIFPSSNPPYNFSATFSLNQNVIPYKIMDQNFPSQAIFSSSPSPYMTTGNCVKPESLQQHKRFLGSQNGELVCKTPRLLKPESSLQALAPNSAAQGSSPRVKQKSISAQDVRVSSLNRDEFKQPGYQWVQRGMMDGDEMLLTVVNHLLKAAEAVDLGNIAMAQAILARLNQHLFPQGKPLQRAAYHFKEALAKLVAESEGSFPPLRNNSNNSESSLDILNKISAYTSFCELFVLPQFAHFTTNQAILEAMEGETSIHLIDFELGFGGQWAPFLQEIASRPGGPPKVKITTLGAESIEMDLIRRNLYEFAKGVKASFELQVIPFGRLDNLTTSMFGVHEQEAVAVNFAFGLNHILEGFCSINSISSFLQLLKDLSPKVVTMVDMELQGEGFSLFKQFLESLKFYVSLFESLEVTTDLPMEMILKIEKYVFAPKIIHLLEKKKNVKFPHWEALLKRAGFSPLPFSPAAEIQADCLIQNQHACIKGFQVVKNQGCLHLEWQGRTLVSAFAWSS